MSLTRLLLCLLLLPLDPAHAFATLGPAANCQYRTTLANPIQKALDDGHVELRLVGNATFTGSFIVAGTSDVQIRGGFADCPQAANNVLPTTPQPSFLVASASPAPAVTLIPAGTRRRVITMDRIDLRPNLEQSPTGAGIAIGGLLDLRFVRGKISGFKFVGGQGGGVAMSLGVLDLVHSEISQNMAEKGGGIYCASGGTVRLDASSKLFFNQAIAQASAGEGGGAYLDGCTFTSQGRVLPTTVGGTSGIVGNSASHNGGGLMILGGLTSIQGGPFCFDPTSATCLPRLAIIGANSAARGGALFATQNADVSIDYANVSANTASDFGGGMAVIQSQLRFGGLGSTFPNFDRGQCPEGICEVMATNRVRDNGVDAGTGGAIVALASTVALVDILMDDNTAGATDVLSADGGSVILQQALVRQADDPLPDAGIVMTFDETNATIRRSTLIIEPAGTAPDGAARADTALADPPVPQTVIESFDTALTLENTVIGGFGTQVEPLFANVGSTLGGSCNAHAGINVPAGLAAISVPTTIAAFDSVSIFQPAAGSVLIDRCNSDGIIPGARDIRGALRIVSQPGGSPTTPVDIGALERGGDGVFGDGFE